MNRQEIEAKYKEADAKATKASKLFQKARENYRTGKISDKVFLAAQKEHTAALTSFDLAYEEMQNLPEEVEEIEEENPQQDLF